MEMDVCEEKRVLAKDDPGPMNHLLYSTGFAALFAALFVYCFTGSPL